MLRDLKLLPVYDSAESDLISDLIVPLLQNSKSYLRGVGFFTSGWLAVAARGLVSLVENGGKARIVLSPILDEKDWRAIEAGERARRDAVLRDALTSNLLDIEAALTADTRNCLAWLVADGLLDFRFAVPRPSAAGGDYHDKVGVFTDDEGDFVAIHGSFNDTFKGTLNGEAFSVFKSWDSGQSVFAEVHQCRLARLWETGNSQFTVFGVPDAIRQHLVRLRTSQERPYSLPCVTAAALLRPRLPSCPIKLRSFQEEAIRQWEKANCRGIFEMATGTGKTITCLAAAVRQHDIRGQLALVVLVPYLHLLEQWSAVCADFGFSPVSCSSKHAGWEREARSLTQDFSIGACSSLCLLATHQTSTTDKFARLLKRIPGEKLMLVADEAHSLGASTLRQGLSAVATMRLGLSATPQRWYDENGTDVLWSYFSGVCFKFTLEQAIGTFLVPYEYRPILVHLNPQEEAAFSELTARIGLLRPRAEDDYDVAEAVKRLLIERARIIGQAKEKVSSLIKIIKQDALRLSAEACELRDALLYCAPGTHKGIMKEIANLGIRCHEFVHTVGAQTRQKVLSQFADGAIQVLVAVKCLDEGVDVPSTQTAFFLASTTNPREFVQRRGRVLRLCEGKRKAVIFDFVVTPHSQTPPDTACSLMRREMPRFAEFASAAMNQFEARSLVFPILDRHGLLNLLDERPWDLYHALRREKDIEE